MKSNNLQDSLFKTRLWKKLLSIFLAVIMGLGTFVTITFGNMFLSDYVDFRSLITANAALAPTPLFYRYGELVGLYKLNYENTEKIQYKIGEDGEWTDYAVPFSIPAFKTTKVYARIGENGRITYLNLSTANDAIGVYTESNTDFEFSYNNIDFGYTRIYNSADKDWFESIHSKVLVTNSRLEVQLPDSSKYPMIRKTADTYIDELNGYVLTKTNNNYIFDNGAYKYYFEIKALQSVAYLSAIEDYSGNRLNLSRTANTEEISISDGAGRSFALSDYRAIEAPDGSDAQYYSVKEITDPDGNKLEYTTKLGRYIEVTDQAGVILGRYEYNSDTTDHTLIRSTDKSISYYDNGRLKQITYDNGAWEKFNYDDALMTYTTLSSDGRATKTVYNDAFLPVEYTDEYGEVTSYTYDDHYRIVSETAGGATTTYSYDSMGNIISTVTDSEYDDSCYYIYDNNGNIIREQNGDSYNYYTYDDNKNILVSATLKEDYNGEIPDLYNPDLTCFDKTEYTYDSNGRVTEENSSYGCVYKFEYDASGNVTKETTVITDDEGTTTTVMSYTYDSLGNVLTTASENGKSSYIYDNAGRTLLADEDGCVTRTIYDELGRVVQEISSEDYDSAKDGLPEENTYSDAKAGQTYVYAESGNLASETNRLGVTTDYQYNDVGAKIKESFDIYEFNYTDNGDLKNVKIGGSETISYTYDEDNNLVSENYANGDIIRYEYDDRGFISAQYRDDSNSPYVTFAYDANGKLTQKINYDSDLKYIYDENENFEVYRMSDNTLVQSYSETFTKADEEQGIEEKRNISETHFGKAYSSAITDNSIIYSSNVGELEYKYDEDENGRIISDFTKFNGCNSLSSEYTYDDAGNIIRKVFEDGKTFENTYDDEGRISSIEYSNFYNGYEYDNNSQVIYYIGDEYIADYYYDDRGNITEKISPEEELYFSYSDDGWKDQISEINNNPVSYDENGNVIQCGDRYFEWNNGRQLEFVYGDDFDCSYTYDENGIRTSKTVNGVTTYYNTIDGVILSQTDGTNTMYFQYDDSGVPIGFIYNDIQIFYRTNQNGDVIALVTTYGTVIANYKYDAWGRTTAIDIPYGFDLIKEIAAANPLRYRGYYLDNETGYYYLQSRYYDPSICRFINADDYNYINKEEFEGLNMFAYCNNNPPNISDHIGCWGSDVHSGFNTRTRSNYYQFKNSSQSYGTYYWALRVGFSDNFAYFIGYWCNYVDTKYNPATPTQWNNGWHFNSNWATGYKTDTRDSHSQDMIKKAKQELNSANSLNKNNNKKYKDSLRNALIYIGYSLHPIQDKYAHTKSVSKPLCKTKNYIIYYHGSGVDDANKHKNAVNNAGSATQKILKELYKNYSLLRRKDLKFYVK